MSPTRSHFLGSCRTCRRRHVRCDRERPSCSKCRALGVACEGFSDDMCWVPYNEQNSDVTDGQPQGMRRHLYSEKSRLSMSLTLRDTLISGSIDATLAEIERESQGLEQAESTDVVVGPFSVLRFRPGSESETSQSQDQSQPLPAGEIVAESAGDSATSTFLPGPIASPAEMHGFGPVTPFTDPLRCMDDFLHWSDILDLEFNPTDFLSWPASSTLDTMDSPSLLFNLPLAQPDGAPSTTMPHPLPSEPAPNSQRHLSWTPNSHLNTDSSSQAASDVLADAPFLLKHLQENVAPLMVAMPLGRKSPWTMLNMPAAVVTLGDVTFLSAQNIRHARLANLYSILACSALHLTLQPSNNTDRPLEHWQRVTNQAFMRAKEQVQLSLKNELGPPTKAKYKDQMMALCALTEFTIMSGQPEHARCLLLDTERLVRLRGFVKRKISQKARLLHHVYTWHRIVGESTYVLHDYTPSKTFLYALQNDFKSSRSAAPEDPTSRRDSFMRLEINATDRDLNIDERKDKETSLKDIHLEDSRNFPETLYKQIYGIPETWLSLLSQTTRLANVMEMFRHARNTVPNLSFDAWDTLHRRGVRLEYMICSLNSNSRHSPNDSHDETDNPDNANNADADAKSPTPRTHLLRALNAALLIFFYRRIRNLHPQILQHHVDDVLTGLEEFRLALPPSEQIIGLGSIWPAFIAGCEAINSSRREAIVRWLDCAYASCRFPALEVAKEVMRGVWEGQYGGEKGVRARGEVCRTWVDVARQERVWPMLC
ncbi:fungal-specific transcription factor domain-containing protein [Aspergillus carlsbadensis]|nr:fungal-specific transcription factor domain-containing protein [Aspergillus carlsbadensis]